MDCTKCIVTDFICVYINNASPIESAQALVGETRINKLFNKVWPTVYRISTQTIWTIKRKPAF